MGADKRQGAGDVGAIAMREIPCLSAQSRAEIDHLAAEADPRRLSAAQERKVLAHLDQFATTGPKAEAAVAGPRRMIRDLTVGKTAPAF